MERKSNRDDAHGKIVSLTAEGKRLARRGWRVQSEVVTTMLGAMSRNELEQVADLMHRVRSALLPLRAVERRSPFFRDTIWDRSKVRRGTRNRRSS
jgi:hypothetical protein